MEQEYLLLKTEEVTLVLHELSSIIESIKENINNKSLTMIDKNNNCKIKFDSEFLGSSIYKRDNIF